MATVIGTRHEQSRCARASRRVNANYSDNKIAFMIQRRYRKHLAVVNAVNDLEISALMGNREPLRRPFPVNYVRLVFRTGKKFDWIITKSLMKYTNESENSD